jgi:hypothetical protein
MRFPDHLERLGQASTLVIHHDPRFMAHKPNRSRSMGFGLVKLSFAISEESLIRRWDKNLGFKLLFFPNKPGAQAAG